MFLYRASTSKILGMLVLICRKNRHLTIPGYACSCTPLTARPLGSFIPANALSHANASAVLHATLGTLGTLRAALSLGKWVAKSVR